MVRSSDSASVSNHNVSRLIKLAMERFGTPSEADLKLLVSVASGGIADYSADSEEENDPTQAETWGKKRTLRAEIIRWLCIDSEAIKLVSHSGILVKGARISGPLQLFSIRIPFQLFFWRSAFTAEMDLTRAKVRALFLPGTHTLSVKADGMMVEDVVYLREGFKCERGFYLRSAKIGSDLNCEAAHLSNEMGVALWADGLTVDGCIFLRKGFRADGEVRLIGGRVAKDIDCEGGHFINEGRVALDADGITVGGSVFMRSGYKAIGEVRLRAARIGRDLACTGGHLVNKKGLSLNADRISVEGSVQLGKGFKAEGEVRLPGATIGSDLDCVGGHFLNKKGIALNADGITIEGSAFLRQRFVAKGEVRLLRAKIRTDLDCSGGQLTNKKGVAFGADGIIVDGCAFLRKGFKAEGEVRLLGATIKGGISCAKGCFINKNATALNAAKLKAEEDVSMNDGFRAIGTVDFSGASIDGCLIWVKVESQDEVTLDLRSARIGELLDHPNSWPREGHLFLNGLVYERISDGAPTDALSRIDWLHKQDTQRQFRPQPYEHLATVLRKDGHEEDAKQILIQKNKDKACLSELNWPQRLWYFFFGKLIGYGYRPWRAFWIGLIFILLGWAVFGIGYAANVIAPTKELEYVSERVGKAIASKDYPEFSAFMYSLDVFVPIVNLHQACYYLPNTKRVGKISISENWSLPISGRLLRFYLWFQIVAGWIMTTFFVVGLTGLVRT